MHFIQGQKVGLSKVCECKVAESNFENAFSVTCSIKTGFERKKQLKWFSKTNVAVARLLILEISKKKLLYSQMLSENHDKT